MKVQFITDFKPFNLSFHFVFSSLIFLWLLSWTTLSTLHVTNPFSVHTTSTSLSACGLSLILEPRELRFIFVLIIFVGSFFCWCACCLCVCFFHCLLFCFVFLNFLFYFRGRIKHTEVCQLLRQMSPPVGIGKKCPKIVAYKVSKSQLPECHSWYFAELKRDNLFVFWLEGLVGTALNIRESSPFNQQQEVNEQLRTKQITK